MKIWDIWCMRWDVWWDMLCHLWDGDGDISRIFFQRRGEIWSIEFGNLWYDMMDRMSWYVQLYTCEVCGDTCLMCGEVCGEIKQKLGSKGRPCSMFGFSSVEGYIFSYM